MVTNESTIMNQGGELSEGYRGTIRMNAGDDFFNNDIRSEIHV